MMPVGNSMLAVGPEKTHSLTGSDAEKHLNDPMVIAKLQEAGIARGRDPTKLLKVLHLRASQVRR